MALALLTLVASLVTLTIGAELLVRGCSDLARRAGVSSFFIGLTIVGFGTSTPELATGITAAMEGAVDLNVGNVIGSNIFNIAVIVGLSAVICPIPVQTRLVRRESFVMIGVAFLPLLALATAREITRWQAALMLVALAAYMILGYRAGRADAQTQAQTTGPASGPGSRSSAGWLGLSLQLLLVAAGLVALTVGSKLLVDSASTIARAAGVSELVIALTVVSAGTSAPELFTSAVAAVRKQPDIAIGNIIGSNIFNVLGILGVTSLLVPQQVNGQVFVFDVPVMIALSIAMLPIMISHSRVSRLEGSALLLVYAAYLAVLLAIAS